MLGPRGTSGRQADSEPGSWVVEPPDQRGMCNDRAKGQSTQEALRPWYGAEKTETRPRKGIFRGGRAVRPLRAHWRADVSGRI